MYVPNDLLFKTTFPDEKNDVRLVINSALFLYVFFYGFPQVPVMLALLKLAFMYGMEYLNNLRWDSLAEPAFLMQRSLGPDWDLYVMGLLAGLIAAMAYVRRIL